MAGIGDEFLRPSYNKAKATTPSSLAEPILYVRSTAYVSGFINVVLTTMVAQRTYCICSFPEMLRVRPSVHSPHLEVLRSIQYM